jgi:hypothetical protein
MSDENTVSDAEIEIIKHLSSEITTQATYLVTLRSRVFFTILVGPFVVFGSFLLATKDAAISPHFGEKQLKVALIAAGAYLALGLFGAVLDKQVTDQCDRWRNTILKLSKHESLDANRDLLFKHRTFWAYFIVWFLTLAAFISIGGLIFLIFAAH